MSEENNTGVNDMMEYFKLKEEDQNKLLDWILSNFKENINYKKDSYRLKNELPFYVTNGAFKGAMSVLGYQPRNWKDKNWIFITKGKREVSE